MKGAFFGIIGAKSQRGTVNAAEAEEVKYSQQNYDLEGRVLRWQKSDDCLNGWVGLLSVFDLSCCTGKNLDFIRTEHNSYTHANPQTGLLLN